MSTPMSESVQSSGQQTQAILELTKALEAVIEQLAIAPPSEISIFFAGTEVYRYRSTDGSTIWWDESQN
ncbi:hypothetical protein H6F67_11025 [Microcoleus sp. FACHB-1515]|uniref:hypothetical protein n=1 Tax=Cyanophyceae TaxID=3028117 RepID=UPI001685CA36|nr:hypothetical protein [Microcoleus sp. FACHB-1515]MBD2090386.1 hypothetical protein [Microcoleus sp. FACHB-1515]